MSRIFEAQANVQIEIPFSQINLQSVLVSGLAGTITTELYDEDGLAAETVTIAEKGTLGVFTHSATESGAVRDSAGAGSRSPHMAQKRLSSTLP